MNQDVSASAFSSEFAFENHNLRLSTNDSNTLMSWVNEKGTLEMSIVDKDGNGVTLQGTPVGTAVINSQLVLFTTEDSSDEDSASSESSPDHIYVLEYARNSSTGERIENRLLCRTLYSGNINLSVQNPLETLVSYEADHIKKVYWVDGRNQPRIINIENMEFLEKPALVDSRGVDTRFDFVPSVELMENVSITRNETSGGTFAPGVIQYCLTYINRYQQQSNVVYASPLYYLSHIDRGAAPDEKVVCSFTIEITDADQRFDYVRLYAIQRTSVNDVPYVRLVEDLEIDGETIHYTDNGTTGSVLDPQELLYVGGREITAQTFAEKDNTLFMGNIDENNPRLNVLQDHFDALRSEIERDGSRSVVEFLNDGVKTLTLDRSTGIYSHTNTLKRNQREITTLKGGENYRFGFQLQKRTGEWSEPIFIGDETNDKYPDVDITSDVVNLVYAQTSIDLTQVNGFNFSEYRRIRPCIVFPNMNDRRVLCQGVLNPTVFNIEDRKDGYPFAQASWYFRPYCKEIAESIFDGASASDNISVTTGEYIPSHGGDTVNVNTDIDLSDYNVLPVYVMTAGISSTVLAEIRSNRYITICVETRSFNGDDVITREYTNRILGIVELPSDRYLLIGADSFPTVTQESESEGESESESAGQNDRRIYIKEVMSTTQTSAGTSFRLYKKVSSTTDTLTPYFFDDSEERPSDDEYVFICHDGTSRYFITFTNMFDEDSASQGDYDIIHNSAGSAVSFRHYDSLKCMSRGDSNMAAKSVEIQGSEQIYPSPYSTGKDNIRSNSQFFVDQSIVTLNSPDAEFDSELQSFGSEGVKMRIVGAIPITASVSAHSIATSSNMLELNYGQSDDQNEDNSKVVFGSGENNVLIKHNNVDIYANRRLVADYLWNDVAVKETTDDGETKAVASKSLYDYLVYPWHRSGSLNNDPRSDDECSSRLQAKKESTLLYSINTAYLGSSDIKSFSNIETRLIFTEDSGTINYRLKRQKSTSSEINYYSTIDKLLYNTDTYDIVRKDSIASVDVDGDYKWGTSRPVLMRYRSTTHHVVALSPESGSDEIPILPYVIENNEHLGEFSYPQGSSRSTFWGDKEMKFAQSSIDVGDKFNSQQFGCLWLAELYKEPSNPFGGTSRNALRSNIWLPAGDAEDLFSNGVLRDNITLRWTTGDTYYQRYDCLKTYAYSTDDINQLVEILSFMCETRVNIDGRYDKNRGQVKNYNMRPDVFNLLNPAYTQQDNFFTGRKLVLDENDNLKYPNQIYFSKTRTPGADVDAYTNVTLGSSVDVDGDKGGITSIQRLNDQLLVFQDSAIAQIMYNENVQIATQQGVPIEIANSGKVQGVRYLSDTVGCSNKWSVASTPNGIYFIDSHNKELYLFNGKLENISTANGFNTWMKRNIPSSEILWDPKEFRNIVTYYDKLNHDVMFINSDICLDFSEKSGTFTSFYDYGKIPYFCNLLDTGLWIDKNSTIHRHQAGNYCEFFGVHKPYWTTMIANADGTTDKIFTNLEFTASVDGDGEEVLNRPFSFRLPFDYVESWNDYQHGILSLRQMNGTDGMKHFTPSLNTSAALKRKFRLWRCDVPRDNAPKEADEGMNISRYSPKPLDRMRNPWIYFKLQKNADEAQNRTEIHNILMTYYV